MSMSLKTAAIALAGLAALVLLIHMLRSRRGVRALILTVLQGGAALCMVNLLGTLSGVRIALNWVTLGVSAVFGTPGVVGLLLLQFLFR